ncbi:hypothetical protein ACM0EK_22240, partial [Salmonella enterica]
EWVHVQLHQQKGMISLSPPTICNSAVFSHRVKAFICLDDDESLFPVGYPHLQKTNYYTGLTESDLAALNTRYHLLMKRWAS